MRLSWIVTTYDVAPYIGACLDSLGPVLRPGDEVIVVDDGSGDGTADMLARHPGFGPEVDWRPVMLGTNSPGGVGVPANVGLSMATREAFTFLDGDDLVMERGARAARAAFAADRPDILIGDHVDLVDGAPIIPADRAAWRALAEAGIPTGGRPTSGGADEARRLALPLMAVPWRKIYDRAWARRTGLRFPEGDFFYEDNPFHWRACLAAERIAFLAEPVRAHRKDRPGQTMAAQGAELLAFLDHYEDIRAQIEARLPGAGDEEHRLACAWLTDNLGWHLHRLAPEAAGVWGARVSRVLGAVPDRHWRLADGLSRGDRAAIAALRAAGPAEAVALASGRALAVQARETREALARLEDAQARGAEDARALRAAAEIDALAAVLP